MKQKIKRKREETLPGPTVPNSAHLENPSRSHHRARPNALARRQMGPACQSFVHRAHYRLAWGDPSVSLASPHPLALASLHVAGGWIPLVSLLFPSTELARSSPRRPRPPRVGSTPVISEVRVTVALLHVVKTTPHRLEPLTAFSSPRTQKHRRQGRTSPAARPGSLAVDLFPVWCAGFIYVIPWCRRKDLLGLSSSQEH
jgi:hypothetical protein